MPGYSAEEIRNIALVGHSGSGKTTLIEALLAQAGITSEPGRVERGSTVSDFDPLEREYLHSLNSTVVSIDHDRIHLNLIDTPGLPDFIGQSISTFPAVESIAVTINAAAGIETVARRMLQWAAQRKLCRMILINKIDTPECDLPALVAQIRDQFGAECLPINLPAEGGKRVVDCFFNPEGEADFSSVAEAHSNIIDQVIEVDEALMERYLEQGQALQAEQLHDPFEQALREGHLIPICFVSATSGAGIPELLSVFERLMPNPLEGNPPPFRIGEGESEKPFQVVADPQRHVVAHVFKVTADPYIGKLSIFRIHQGTIRPNTQLYIGDGRKPFKVTHLYKLYGKGQQEIAQGIPGDICAVAKVEEITFDAVLHDSHEEDYLHLLPLEFPRPLFGLAIEAVSRGDEQRLGNALQRIVEEDPCLCIEQNAALNETLLLGLGELHLRLTLEKMKQRFNVSVTTRPPRIAYRETITAAAEGFHRHKKQTGGAGQFGEVTLRIEPLARGEGFQFSDASKGGVIPHQFIPAIEKGVLLAMERGVIAGFPLQDLKVTVLDGKHHSVDSKEVAFVSAGKRAFIEAVTKARGVVLEPIVQLDLHIPDDSMGAVSGDLSAKRGHLLATNALEQGMLHLKAEVPLAEISEYANQLNALTGGRGSYTLAFSHYQPVPAAIQQQLTAAFIPTEEEE